MVSIFDSSVKASEAVAFSTASKRSIHVARFEKKDRPVLAIWFDDKVPSDDLSFTPVDMTIEGVTFRSPVYVELITGRVYDLSSDHDQQEGSGLILKGLPLWDSPILIVERSQAEIVADH